VSLMRIKKDPRAVLDYGLSWSDWLDEDEHITGATWTIPDGITKTSDQTGSENVVVWLSGGTLGDAYEVSCRIETSKGRTDSRSFTIIMGDR